MEILWKISRVVIASYLLGSIPSSYIMGRITRGIDLREHGSGNLGAANTFRILGAGAAIPVLLFDIGKGYLAVKLVSMTGIHAYGYILLAALVVIIGHTWSIFVRFSGGKGIGTTSGAFLAMAPVAVGICFGIWLVALLVSRIVSVASILAVFCLPFSILLVNRWLGAETHISVVYLSVVVTVLVIYKHRSNIGRLFNGTERKIF